MNPGDRSVLPVRPEDPVREGRMKEVHNRLFSQVAHIPGRITALFRGRAAQRSMEAALQESGVRLQLVQELAGAGIWEWKKQTGEMTWDARVSQLLGLDPVKDPASYQTWNRVLHPDDRENAHSEMERVLQELLCCTNQYSTPLPSLTDSKTPVMS